MGSAETQAGTPLSTELSVRTYHLLWRCLLCSVETLSFCDSRIIWESRCCWCCCTLPVIRENVDELRAGYQPFLNAARLLRDAAVSFIVALLFHLIPSIIWGAEESLGSAHNHQLMGAVWFGGWPFWFLVMSALRPPGLHLSSGYCSTFVPFNSLAHAQAVAAWRHSAPARPKPTASVPLCDAWMVAGLIVWLVLIGNGIFTGAEVMACIGRGCCKDDSNTIDCCVATGYPNASSCRVADPSISTR